MPISLARQQSIREVERLGVELAQGAVDVALSFGLLDWARYVVLKSDVVLSVRVNGVGSTPLVGATHLLVDAAVRTLHLTNKGSLYDEGKASGGGAAVLSDTTKSWGYTTLKGTSVTQPFDLGEVKFVVDVNGHSALIELSGDDQTGAQTATLIQNAIDASSIGSGEVTVSWETISGDEGRFVFVNQRLGAYPIEIGAYLQDYASLLDLGLYEPVSQLGDVSMENMVVEILAGGPVGDIRTVTSTFSTTSLTVDSNWTTPVVAGDEYRIYRPQEGKVDILLAR
jgi:hypothetical protein